MAADPTARAFAPEPPSSRFPPVQSRVLAPSSTPSRPHSVRAYDTLYVETGRFLAPDDARHPDRGAPHRGPHFATPGDIAALPERLVFTCTGLGARALFGDHDSPRRGQLAIILPQPKVRYAYHARRLHVPPPDGILLGGTFELDEWGTEPQPAAIAQILAAHQRLVARFRCTA
jgi:hypothetical protein